MSRRPAGRLLCSSPQGLAITKPKAIIVLQKRGGGTVERDRGEIMITDSTEFFLYPSLRDDNVSVCMLSTLAALW